VCLLMFVNVQIAPRRRMTVDEALQHPFILQVRVRDTRVWPCKMGARDRTRARPTRACTAAAR
jgi:hypothetical protein